jgi:hypothetical protein
MEMLWLLERQCYDEEEVLWFTIDEMMGLFSDLLVF